ncbi:hypothetical protein GDO78_016407 [Eleutherodactylus coqui]|uniref:Uncharacterized protein n=1 Tax=Eleutherodactylus coqui TaxID=57060 RepID=A0A8J6B1S3_ELECQ|nr:hypothetical protein GDO78_016407 [Eleutherodactylus coqui]
MHTARLDSDCELSQRNQTLCPSIDPHVPLVVFSLPMRSAESHLGLLPTFFKSECHWDFLKLKTHRTKIAKHKLVMRF